MVCYIHTGRDVDDVNIRENYALKIMISDSRKWPIKMKMYV